MTSKTKSAPAAVDVTAIQPTAPEANPTVLTFGQLPRDLTLSGPSHTVFAQAVVLARRGYIFSPAQPPQVFPSNGLSVLFMTIGCPDEHAIKGADEATQQAVADEQRAFEQRVEHAAKQLLAEQADKARKAEAAAAIVAAEVALAAARKAAE